MMVGNIVQSRQFWTTVAAGVTVAVLSYAARKYLREKDGNHGR